MSNIRSSKVVGETDQLVFTIILSFRFYDILLTLTDLGILLTYKNTLTLYSYL